MKLNRTYPALLALLLMATFAGCRQEPLPASGDVLRFTVSSVGVSSATTKADPVLPAATLPGDKLDVNGNKVTVWGTLTEGGTSRNVFNTATLDLMCSKTGTGSATWDYSGTRYLWNPAATFQFRSVFTDNHDADIQSGSSSQITVNYSGDYDLMAAYTAVPAAASQSAQLVFLHATSAVRFFVIDPSRADGESANYTISNFALKGVSKTGTLTFTGSGSPTPVTQAEWTSATPAETAYAATGLLKSVPNGNVTDEQAALTGWLYFVPQVLPSEAKVTFSFTAVAGGQTIDVERSLSGTWAPGVAYTYYILIQPNAIDVTVQWTDWVNVEHDYGQVG